MFSREAFVAEWRNDDEREGQDLREGYTITFWRSGAMVVGV
jgi:hypothetical protein